MSPALGVKYLVPAILSKSNKKLAASYRILETSHVVESVALSHQPPPLDVLRPYVERFNPLFHQSRRPLRPLFRVLFHPAMSSTTPGNVVNRVPTRLDWTAASRVHLRKDLIPELDVGIEFEDYRPLDTNASQSEFRRRRTLEWVNEAECQIALDLGESNLVVATVNHQGETSDIVLCERKGTGVREYRNLQLQHVAFRDLEQTQLAERLFEGEHNLAPIDGHEALLTMRCCIVPAGGQPVLDIESFFSDEVSRQSDNSSPTSFRTLTLQCLDLPVADPRLDRQRASK